MRRHGDGGPNCSNVFKSRDHRKCGHHPNLERRAMTYPPSLLHFDRANHRQLPHRSCIAQYSSASAASFESSTGSALNVTRSLHFAIYP